jgi:hypothetical protein
MVISSNREDAGPRKDRYTHSIGMEHAALVEQTKKVNEIASSGKQADAGCNKYYP